MLHSTLKTSELDYAADVNKHLSTEVQHGAIIGRIRIDPRVR